MFKSTILYSVFSPEIVRVIMSFIPYYERCNVKKEFFDLLEVQLMEPRHVERPCIAKKYISYYDNIRDNKIYQNDWVRVSPDEVWIEDYFTCKYSTMVYDVYISKHQQDYPQDLFYRKVDIYIKDQCYDMKKNHAKIMKDYIEMLSIPFFTNSTLKEDNKLLIKFFTCTPFLGDTDEIEQQYSGKNYIMSMIDNIVWYARTNLHRKFALYEYRKNII